MASGYSIQRGSTSFASGDTQKVVTISAITMTKSWVVFTIKQNDGSFSAGDNLQGILAIRGNITSSTQVTFNRIVSGYAVTVEWFVITASSGLTVQRGYVANVNNSGYNVTISSVNLSKTWAIVSCAGWNSYNPNRSNEIEANLNSTTNLFLSSKESNAWNSYTEWQVIQDDDASVQKVSKSPTGTSDSVTISSVDMSRTFIAATNEMDYSGQLFGQIHWNYYLANSTAIAFTRDSSGDNGCDFTIYVVSNSAVNVTRFQTAISTSDTSKNVTIALSGVNNGAIIGDSSWFKSCMRAGSGTSKMFANLIALKLNSATEANLSRYASDSESGTVYWELLDFGNLSQSINLNGISSAETVPSPSVSPGNVNLAVNSTYSAEVFGSLALIQNLIIVPQGIATTEQFGSAALAYILKEIGKIVSSEAFGSLILSRGSIAVSINGINSEEAFGLLTALIGGTNINLNSITGSEQFGSCQINISIELNAVNSSEEFGQIMLTVQGISFAPYSIESEEAFGSVAVVSGNVQINLNSIVNLSEISELVVRTGNVDINSSSIESEEAFGSASIIPETTFIEANSVQSVEEFGLISTSVGYVDIEPIGIESSENISTPYVTVSGVQISTYSIQTEEALGDIQVITGSVSMQISGISSQEAFGQVAISTGPIELFVESIESAEGFGLAAFQRQVVTYSISSEEGFGVISISTGNVSINVTSIQTEEQLGFAIVRNVLVLILDGLVSEEGFGIPFIVTIVRNSFERMMENDLQDVFFNIEEFAENVLYICKDGTTFQLTVIFDDQSIMIDPDTGAEVLSSQPMMQAQSSDFKIRPDKGDKVLRKGIRYQIISHEPDGVGVTSFRLHHERTV